MIPDLTDVSLPILFFIALSANGLDLGEEEHGLREDKKDAAVRTLSCREVCSIAQSAHTCDRPRRKGVSVQVKAQVRCSIHVTTAAIAQN